MKMNHAEVALITKKVKNVKIFIIAFFAFVSLWFWIWNRQEFPYSFLNITINTILILFILLLILGISKKNINTRKDFINQIKVIDELIISNKYIHGSGNDVRYYICFDSKILKEYDVKANVFNSLNINDSVHIEYSKYANWILKIEHNGIDIENKQMIS